MGVQKQFVIVGTQRSGSGFLADLVNQHPEVHCGWEWGQKAAPYRKLAIADAAIDGDFSQLRSEEQTALESLDQAALKALGFRKLFRCSEKWLLSPSLSPALAWDRMGATINWIRQRQFHVIQLVRADTLAWLNSKVNSKAANSFQGSDYSEARVEIQLAPALRRAESKQLVDNRLGELTQTNPYLRVDYEDCVATPGEVTRRIDAFLEVDPAARPESASTRTKQSNSRLEDQVLNYAALREALQERGLLAAGEQSN